MRHNEVQERGRGEVLSDYHLRLGDHGRYPPEATRSSATSNSGILLSASNAFAFCIRACVTHIYGATPVDALNPRTILDCKSPTTSETLVVEFKYCARRPKGYTPGPLRKTAIPASPESVSARCRIIIATSKICLLMRGGKSRLGSNCDFQKMAYPRSAI